MDSARMKKMINDIEGDVHYYKKMSEVYQNAE